VKIKKDEIFTVASSNQEIKIFDMSKNPIEYPDANRITENKIRIEHGLPIRTTYYDDRKAIKRIFQ